MMNILCDYHHDQLLDSIQKLASRLDAKLHVMGGMDWYNKGFWKVGPHEGTALQFLCKGMNIEYVSLDEACDIKWDVILVSHIDQFQSMRQWRDKFSPKSPLVAQVGNEWVCNHPSFEGYKNILNTTEVKFPSSIHQCKYHPEFEVSYTPHKKPWIGSFTHLISQEAIDLGKNIAIEIQPIHVRMYGASCPDGPARQSDVDRYIREWMALYLYKIGGDGYGFSGHMALANGMPIIARRQDYQSNTLGVKLRETVNFCDIDLGFDHVVDFIKEWDSDVKNRSFKARQHWLNTVDFDWEFTHVLKPFFENII